MSRPKANGRTGVRRSFYLSPEVSDFLTLNSSGNGSGFLDSFVKAHMSGTRELKAIEIKQLTKEIIDLQSELNKKIAIRDLLQSEYNLHKEPEDMRGKARQDVLEYYVTSTKSATFGDSPLKVESMFMNGLTGPGRIHMIKECGWANAQEALAWCKSQKVSK